MKKSKNETSITLANDSTKDQSPNMNASRSQSNTLAAYANDEKKK